MMNPLPVIGCTIVLLVVCAWILSLTTKRKSIRQTPTTPYQMKIVPTTDDLDEDTLICDNPIEVVDSAKSIIKNNNGPNYEVYQKASQPLVATPQRDSRGRFIKRMM